MDFFNEKQNRYIIELTVGACLQGCGRKKWEETKKGKQRKLDIYINMIKMKSILNENIYIYLQELY